MLKGFSDIRRFFNRYRTGVMALGLSVLLHALLLWPSPESPAPEVRVPVLLAELRTEHPRQPQRQHDSAAETSSTAQLSSPAVSHAPAEPPARATTPAPRQPVQTHQTIAAPAITRHAASAQTPLPAAPQPQPSGLTFSKDDQISDPLEITYQQQLLAHLQQRLRAPAHLNGSVRLEIRFSYRQIATHIQVLHSSGDPLFDDWAQKAVMAANPFPPVPAQLPPDYIFRPTIRTEE